MRSRRVNTSRSLRGPTGAGIQEAMDMVPHWMTRPNKAICRSTTSAMSPPVLSKKTLTPLGQVSRSAGSSGFL